MLFLQISINTYVIYLYLMSSYGIVCMCMASKVYRKNMIMALKTFFG